jgi:hypothetical protein
VVGQISCDRGSPYLNCTSAKLNDPQHDCIQCSSSKAEGIDISAIVSQRCSPLDPISLCKLLIWSCSVSEKKIDDIARSIDGIKLFLQAFDVPPGENPSEISSIGHLSQVRSTAPLPEPQSNSTSGGPTLWDHSAHIIDFIKLVVEDIGSRGVSPNTNKVLSSLKSLVQTLEGPTAVRALSFPEVKAAAYQADPPMPPLETVVAVLRWTKG